jgi:hypothetical protein
MILPKSEHKKEKKIYRLTIYVDSLIVLHLITFSYDISILKPFFS